MIPRGIGITLVYLLISASVSHAQVMPVPVDIQMALFSKALRYERQLPERIGADTLVIAIIYQKNYGRSVKITTEVQTLFSSLTSFGGFTFRYISVDISSMADVADANTSGPDRIKTAAAPETDSIVNELVANKAALLYVTPLQNVNIDFISKISRTARILSLTGLPHYVRSGLSVSLELQQGKPRLLFNLPALRAEGSNFSATLLRMAEVIY